MENEVKTTNAKNFKYFLKKYGYYISLGVLLIVLSVAIVLTSLNADKNNGGTEPTSGGVISFDCPVLNASVLKSYSDTELQYNSTLKLWETHKGIDYSAAVGTNVLACYDGKISSISTNLLDGTVIEIDHGNGLKSRYGSLDKDVSVKVGDIVKKGDVIGKASNTATSETIDDGQVHFEVWKDGNVVDPSNYLNASSEK